MARRILVIEAEPSFRETVVRLVEHEGFEARGAASGDEALDCLESGDFQVVLCGVVEAGADPSGLAARLRRERPDLGLVLLVSPERAESLQASVPAVAD